MKAQWSEWDSDAMSTIMTVAASSAGQLVAVFSVINYSEPSPRPSILLQLLFELINDRSITLKFGQSHNSRRDLFLVTRYLELSEVQDQVFVEKSE